MITVTWYLYKKLAVRHNSLIRNRIFCYDINLKLPHLTFYLYTSIASKLIEVEQKQSFTVIRYGNKILFYVWKKMLVWSKN